MNIALNLLPVVPGRTGGLEVYARGIVRGFAELPDFPHELTLLTNEFNHDAWPEANGIARRMVRVGSENQLLRVASEQLRLPGVLRDLRTNLVHSIGGVAVFGTPAANVVTLHDLLYLHAPHVFSRGQLAYRRVLIPASVRRAAHVVVDSNFTRADVIARLGADPARTSTVHLGVAPAFRRLDAQEAAASAAELERTHGVCAPYVFYLGTLSPHKNVNTLVRALALAKNQGVDLELLLAGPAQTDASLGALRALAAELRVRLRTVGYLSQDQLVALYNNAVMHVLPSMFEGFGLTVVEAMACGCAVVASRRASIPELTGSAAILVDPGAPDEFANAIVRVVRDDALRARLQSEGVLRAARWSWDATVCQLLNVYERAAVS